jgi:hypothetical protein
MPYRKLKAAGVLGPAGAWVSAAKAGTETTSASIKRTVSKDIFFILFTSLYNLYY